MATVQTDISERREREGAAPASSERGALAVGRAELAGAIAGAVLLVAGVAAGQLGAERWVAVALYGAAYAAAGWVALREAGEALRSLTFSIDGLMLVAAAGAAAIGHWAEGALLLVLFAGGHAGELIAMGRARRAVKSLYDVMPETAVLLEDGETRETPASSLRAGDVVVVRAGERVPADGVVESGASAVNLAAITGESAPVEAVEGVAVLAGGINGDGRLEVRVTKAAHESALARAVRLVEEAQAEKSRTERLTDRVARWYSPLVLVTALGVAGCGLVLDGSAREWLYRSIAFLTAASPCALVIGAPAATLSALGRAARLGVIVKGGATLERLGRVRAVAIDKTGTLTRGEPRVVRASGAGGEEDGDEALRIAAALESGSAHPFARAIVEEAEARGLPVGRAERVEQRVGLGLVGEVEGRRAMAGSLRLVGRDAAGQAVTSLAESAEREGSSAVVVCADERCLGVIEIADRARPEARGAMERLRSLGVERVVMLTGDSALVAESVAKEVGVDEAHAELLPEDKLRRIEVIEREWGACAMVGDGVNDAPALARASVGIAMGAAGSDAALETADVALMHDSLARLPDALELARRARGVITQNLLIALGVIAIVAPLAAAGYASIGWAVVLHEGSTVVVVLNALRMLRFRPSSG